LSLNDVRNGERLEFTAPLAEDMRVLLCYLRGRRDEIGHGKISHLRKVQRG